MPAKIKLLPPEPSSVPAELTEVQERVDRLEDAVAALCDTQTLEERIAERVALKLTQHEIQLPPLPQGSAAASAPPPSPAPAAAVKVQATAIAKEGPAPVAAFAEFPSEGLPTAPQASRSPLVSFMWGLVPETSLLRDMAWDGRTLMKLLRDPGYQLTWSFRTLPLTVFFLVFIYPKVSPWLGWLVPQVTLGLIGVVVDIFLIYFAFKIVQRELRRYADFAAKYRSQSAARSR